MAVLVGKKKMSREKMSRGYNYIIFEHSLYRIQPEENVEITKRHDPEHSGGHGVS